MKHTPDLLPFSKIFTSFFRERFRENDSSRSFNLIFNWYTLFTLAVLDWAIEIAIEGGPIFSPDSQSYIDAWNYLVNGSLDLNRTPGYPLVIGLCKAIFGQTAGLYAVLVLQEIFFLISVIFFRDICRMTISGRRLQIIMTAIYLLLYIFTFFNENAWLDPESIAFSGIVILLWITIRAYYRPTVVSAFWISALIAWSILVRPGYIYFLPFYTLYWIIVAAGRFMNCRSTVITGLIGVVAVSGMTWAYSQAIERQYGYKGLTNVTTFNNYCFVREFHLLRPELAENDTLRAMLEEYKEKSVGFQYGDCWKEMKEMEKFDPYYAGLQQVVVASMISQHYHNATAMLKRLPQVGEHPAAELCYKDPMTFICHAYFPRLSTVYLFLIAFTVVLVRVSFRRRFFPAISWLLLIFVLMSHFVAIVAAQLEWGRLTQQSLPALLILIAEFCTLFRYRKKDVTELLC